jgi:hypothetical protein
MQLKKYISLNYNWLNNFNTAFSEIFDITNLMDMHLAMRL